MFGKNVRHVLFYYIFDYLYIYYVIILYRIILFYVHDSATFYCIVFALNIMSMDII